MGHNCQGCGKSRSLGGDKVEVVYGNYRMKALCRQAHNAGWDLSGGHVSQSGGGNSAKGKGKGKGKDKQGSGSAKKPGAASASQGHVSGTSKKGGKSKQQATDQGGAGDSGMSWAQNWGGTWRTVSTSTKGDTDTTTAGDSKACLGQYRRTF